MIRTENSAAYNTVYKLWLGQSTLGKSNGFSKASFYQESSVPRHATAHIHQRYSQWLTGCQVFKNIGKRAFSM